MNENERLPEHIRQKYENATKRDIRRIIRWTKNEKLDEGQRKILHEIHMKKLAELEYFKMTINPKFHERIMKARSKEVHGDLDDGTPVYFSNEIQSLAHENADFARVLFEVVEMYSKEFSASLIKEKRRYTVNGEEIIIRPEPDSMSYCVVFTEKEIENHEIF